MAVIHTFNSGKADGGDATLVRPSDWNANHTLTGLDGDWLALTGTTSLDLRPNPREFLFLHEEFIGGRAIFADALGGELGWSATSGTTSRVAGERGRPGIVRYTTSSTINNLIRMELLAAVNGEFGPVDLLEWRMHWGVRASQLTQTNIRIGFLNPTSGNPPADGIYFENISTTGAANWFGVSRAASTESTTDTSTLLDTSFHDFEMRNDGSNNITFFIDGTQVGGALTTNIPTANMVIVLQVENTEAVAKDINIDYWTFWMAVSR